MGGYINEIYEHFKLSYNVTDDDVDHWGPGLAHEIIVHLKNGEILCFDDNTKSFGYIYEHEFDGRGDYVLDDAAYKKAFSRKLRRIMLSRKINQRQLSDATGINIGTLSHYMNGRNLPDLRNARRICLALDCDMFELTEVQ